MKVVSLVGARPQYIKEAVMYQSMKKYGIDEVVVNSGQHYDYNMSDIFFQTLGIGKPDYNLKVGSGKHGEMTAKVIIEFEKVLEKESPDLVLLYGDTNTTLAGAVVSSKMKIPIGHVEAGLRMKPKDMPEEINRVMTDRVSKYLFCPSPLTIENLKKEGIVDGVYFTGDVLFDLFLKLRKNFKTNYISRYNLVKNEFFLVTIHRDYNTDSKERLTEILTQLKKLSKEVKVLFAMHPRTKSRCEEFGLNSLLKGITVVDPIEYLELMGLVENCRGVITDSGGLQKESYFARKSSIVVMTDPAWHELVEIGANIVSDPENIYKNALEIGSSNKYPLIFGEGDAGDKIVKLLLENEK